MARVAGITVRYLPGLAMRRIADLHPGDAKTDARNAFIIAEAARSMPHTLRSIQMTDEQLAELTMLCGFDDDLAKQAIATSNRIRGQLIQIPRHSSVSLARAWSTRPCWNCCRPGTNAATIVLPQLARVLADIRESRDTVSPRLKPSWRPTLFTRS